MNKITIPKKFTIQGREVTVSYNDNIMTDENRYGCINYLASSIELQSTGAGNKMPKCQVEHVFFHEVVHYMLSVCKDSQYKDIDKDENFVDRLAGCIHQFLLTQQGDIDND